VASTFDHDPSFVRRAGESSGSEGFRTFDHTGDLGLEAWAPSPGRPFGLAVEALMAQIALAEDEERTIGLDLALEGPDPSDLLVHWMNTALLRASIEHAIWTHATIHQWTERSIRARLEGPRIDPGRHVLLREVKAVSHHDLLLDLTARPCRMRVVLDI
jgi:SHS2 domain-containing protein